MTHAPPITPLQPATDPADDVHLTVLSVMYYIWAGLTALMGCGGILYALIGALFLSDPAMASDPNDPPPEVLGWILVCMGGTATIVGLVFAVCAACVGWFISKCTHRVFCFVIAGVSCLSIPLGTALGIYTFIALSRPGIAQRFEMNRHASVGYV